MILIDANILLYAYNADAAQHSACRHWLEGILGRNEAVGFSWSTILSFLRLSTDSRVFAQRAVGRSRRYCKRMAGPADCVAASTEGWAQGHPWRLVREGQARPLIMDAHLAALAIEHGAALCTNDRDFMRFPGLKLLNPLRVD
jgi:uncharacterized protein